MIGGKQPLPLTLCITHVEKNLGLKHILSCIMTVGGLRVHCSDLPLTASSHEITVDRQPPAVYTLGSNLELTAFMLPWGCSQPMTEYSSWTRAQPFLPNAGLL